MTEKKPKIIKKKKLPMNYMVDEFAEQQKVTLAKLNKGGKKNDDGSNATTKRE